MRRVERITDLFDSFHFECEAFRTKGLLTLHCLRQGFLHCDLRMSQLPCILVDGVAADNLKRILPGHLSLSTLDLSFLRARAQLLDLVEALLLHDVIHSGCNILR